MCTFILVLVWLVWLPEMHKMLAAVRAYVRTRFPLFQLRGLAVYGAITVQAVGCAQLKLIGHLMTPK